MFTISKPLLFDGAMGTMLQKTGPVSFFAPEMPPDKALQRENNGSELLLLDAAQELPHVLEEPIRT